VSAVAAVGGVPSGPIARNVSAGPLFCSRPSGQDLSCRAVFPCAVAECEPEVAFSRAPHRRDAIAGYNPFPPGAVHPVEDIGLQQGQAAADHRRPLRDQVRVAVHEADPPAVRDHRQDVAGEERPAVTVGPVQYLAAGEVDADVDERQPVADLAGVTIPELDRGVGARDPLAVGGVDVYRGVEGMGPLDHRAVEVRVADRYRADPAQFADLRDKFVVEVGDHVPQHVPARRPDQESALANRDGWLSADPDDAGSLFLNPAAVPGRGELGQCRPLLPVPADVLAFVQADRAVLARLCVLDAAGPADRKVGAHVPDIPDAARPPLRHATANGRNAILPNPRGNWCRDSQPSSVTRTSSPVCTPARSSLVMTLGWMTTVIPAVKVNSAVRWVSRSALVSTGGR